MIVYCLRSIEPTPKFLKNHSYYVKWEKPGALMGRQYASIRKAMEAMDRYEHSAWNDNSYDGRRKTRSERHPPLEIIEVEITHTSSVANADVEYFSSFDHHTTMARNLAMKLYEDTSKSYKYLLYAETTEKIPAKGVRHVAMQSHNAKYGQNPFSTAVAVNSDADLIYYRMALSEGLIGVWDFENRKRIYTKS